MTEQNYSRRFSRFYPSRSSRTFYNGSLCVRFKNVPHDTQGWCIHLYTEQHDGGRKGEGLGGESKGEHARTLHTFPMAGGGIRTVSSTDENRDQPKPVGERQSKRMRDRKREREQRGEGKRKREMEHLQSSATEGEGENTVGAEKRRERNGKGPSHESLLFSCYPRLGAIVIDWRCGTSPDPPLSFSFSPPLSHILFLLRPLPAIQTRYSLSGNPLAPSTKACAPTHHRVHMINTIQAHGHAHTHTRIHAFAQIHVRQMDGALGYSSVCSPRGYMRDTLCLRRFFERDHPPDSSQSVVSGKISMLSLSLLLDRDCVFFVSRREILLNDFLSL